jgi:uncharacterized repeat protein (TIGR03803 family)
MRTLMLRMHCSIWPCLAIGALFAVLAGCSSPGGSTLSTSLHFRPGTSTGEVQPRQTHLATEFVLHRFAGLADGSFPDTNLTNVKGTLYGTTITGGGGGSICSYGTVVGCGTVFTITTGGSEKVLHVFGIKPDGRYPYAGLTKVRHALYGTTGYGGGYTQFGPGTVFTVTIGGSEKVIHVFGSGTDGIYPRADLTDVNGTLYGTTENGGTGQCKIINRTVSCGTVFKITTTGSESVLYSFGAGTDGRFPQAGLTNVNGALYGTTSEGGTHSRGTVFKITTSGAENVLYSFAGGTDGWLPQAALTNVNGTLYGTTTEGGAGCGYSSGCGTVFKITTSGAESVLYSFKGGADGWLPQADLTNVNGTLYGTTYAGGTSNLGTVFKITTAGSESVLYSFKGGTDGATPIAALTNVKGALYGTTWGGGAGCSSGRGCGTVFKVIP